MINEGMFSSKSSRWETPEDFFDKLNNEFNFDVDVCATKQSTKCEKFFNESIDGLSESWSGTCYMNPPYGREINKWIKKAYEESRKDNCVVIALIPSRTDTRWWHDYVMKANEIRFVIGRLKFINRSFPSFREDGNFKKSPAPFPSAVIIWKNNSIIYPKVIGMER